MNGDKNQQEKGAAVGDTSALHVNAIASGAIICLPHEYMEVAQPKGSKVHE